MVFVECFFFLRGRGGVPPLLFISFLQLLVFAPSVYTGTYHQVAAALWGRADLRARGRVCPPDERAAATVE